MLEVAHKTDENFAPPVAIAAPARAPGHAARRDLLHRISNFLLDLELDVNPGNLALAQEVVSGSNVDLGRQIVARQNANEPVTQAWLDDVTSEAAEASNIRAQAAAREVLDSLIGKIEQSLQQFSKNAGEASAIASDYHAGLSETASRLDAARPLVELPALTQLTHAMIERTRTLEEEMRRREAEAASLFECLQLARADVAMDDLTGMDNARTFDAVLKREVAAARKAGQPLSVAYCDIDRFKLIKDTHGEDTGNRVIRAVAKVLQRISGQSCHVAGPGGEKFVLLFRGITPDDAGNEIDNARNTFAQRKLIDRKTEMAIGSVTFSGGVADALAYGDPQAALKAAGAALDEAKDQGRNRIVVASKRA
jgi:diguanylate cyclase